MNKTRFECSQCGDCCSSAAFFKGANEDMEEKNERKIILYPEEADLLQILAEKHNINLKLEENMVLPDDLNKEIIITKYEIEFIYESNEHPRNNEYSESNGQPETNGQSKCPFHSSDGCIIYDNRPMACRAFPLILKEIDPSRHEILVSESCQNLLPLGNEETKGKNPLTANELKDNFPIEHYWILRMFNQDKEIDKKLRSLQEKEKISLNTAINPDEFAHAMEKWKRKKLYMNEI